MAVLLRSLILFFLLQTANDAVCQAGSADTEKFITLADPAILNDKGVYYLYGTVGGNADNGFQVYLSTDLKKWRLSTETPDGFALKKGDAYGDKGFWAPHVFKYRNRYYMAYVANENIAIAVSDFPYGPFTQEIKAPLAAPVKQIDPFVFFDKGKIYMYHVRLTKGNRLFVAEMNEDLSAIKEETLRECLSAEDKWENTAGSEWPVAEGPTVIKRKGLYYFIYSANDFRNPDYAVGYATASDPMGNWNKYRQNPILTKKQAGINGPGHGDLFYDKKGRMYYVFHTHQSDTRVGPRKTAIVEARFVKTKEGEKLEFLMDTMYFLEKDSGK